MKQIEANARPARTLGELRLTRLAGIAATLALVPILGLAAPAAAEKEAEPSKERIAAKQPAKPAPQRPTATGKTPGLPTGTSATQKKAPAAKAPAQRALPPDPCGVIVATDLDCNANGILDACDIADGMSDRDRNGVLDSCQHAEGDLDLDGIVGARDLAAVLAGWGEVKSGADLNDDEEVGPRDLAIVLANWGSKG